MRTVLLFALLTPVVGSARVPDAGDVLARSAAWAKDLPAGAVEYGLRIGDDGRQGTLTLTAKRAIESTEPAVASSAAFAVWAALLRGDGATALQGIGVDAGVTALYHLQRRVVVIVGARPLDASRPQVWFDRETGAPVRVLVSGEDLVLGDHDYPGTLGRFPGTLRWSHADVHVSGAFRRITP